MSTDEPTVGDSSEPTIELEASAAESIEELTLDNPDDPQLKIRIPNPKIYMARQSLWTGHRGKLRCDSCRAQNLKCDRAQPVCNHCAWTPEKECKYTPIPTPSHRGVPRCVSCQKDNLKCDRDLPVCNQCKLRGNNPPCTYASKKRRTAAAAAEGSVSVTADPGVEEQPQGSTSGKPIPLVSPYAYSAHPRASTSSSTPSSEADDQNRATNSNDPTQNNNGGFHDRSHSYVTTPIHRNTGTIMANTNPRCLAPWSHVSFVALPSTIRSRLSAIVVSELPDKQTFERKLSDFLSTLVPELEETACFSTDTYAAINRSLLSGEAHGLSSRMLIWVNCHRLLPGSTQKYLLLMPRHTNEKPLEPTEEADLLKEYQSRIDRDLTEITPGQPEPVFDRLIVREQFYDVLVYAHISLSHASSHEMTDEINRLAITGVTWPMADIFVNLCPRCSASRRSRSDE
ncbi:fungal specific transcription [Moniliophthora roreri MCA 2997]|uniref:Fungal specific transcription n=2 Tax=Moniliophthora roreri TaxID=221103 RepID=V2X1E1_MONRO|nr:fungal specific transcription [Moniliophthora roreri MCA 2997]KAI3615161.1 fungal specific transcription [Moniliophthora roreri]